MEQLGQSLQRLDDVEEELLVLADEEEGRLVCVVAISMNADLLRDFSADSCRNFFMLIMTVLPGNILADLMWLINTLLLRDILTCLPGNINTLLLRDLITNWICHLSFLGLWNIFTCVIGIILAGPWYRCPYLAVSFTLP